MSRIAEVLRDAAGQLEQTSQTPRLDAEILMAHALGLDRSTLLMRHHALDVPDGFAALLHRRLLHEPIAYITGVQSFWDLDLQVTPAVLIPRADSETLIEVAQRLFAANPPSRILDLGTGSGALLLAALSLFPKAQAVGVDASERALAVARHNARATGRAGRCKFLLADWTNPDWQAGIGGKFDLILANPPYVETTASLDRDVVDHEPAKALFSGPEGLDDYRVLIPQLPALMAKGALAIVEIGFTQADAVCRMAEACGLATRVHDDLSGRPRAVTMGKVPTNI